VPLPIRLRGAALVAFLLAVAGCAPAPPASVAFSFALLGDVPYSQAQANLLDNLIDRMNAEPLAFVVHLGDITSGTGPCDDEWLEARRRQFGRVRHPFVLLPGDNDWTDCHRSGFEPPERLAKWRTLFCTQPALVRFERQAGAYCEHVRWSSAGLLFVALNVPGSNNNLADEFEHEDRMQAVFAWLESSARLARWRDEALVVLLHANPFARRREPNGYAALIERLGTLAKERPGRVFLAHGDTHTFRDDEPLSGLRRIEVFGSPHVRWLRASVVREALRVEPVELP